MHPRLIALDGPMKGTSIELAEDEVAIGRSPASRLPIRDLSVSRQHCVIRRQGETFTIHDLGSTQGTFLNGVPVTEHSLSHGDQITIGDSVFLFTLGEDQAPPGPDIAEIEECDLRAHTTISIKLRDALYLQPDKLQAQLPAGDRIARNLNTLIRISATISSLREPHALQQRLLELILEVIPADRATILLLGKEVEEFASATVLDRQLGPGQPARVSRTITRQVLRDRAALLSNDVHAGGASSFVQSINTTDVRSVLCLPLESFGKLMGLLYLDAQDTTTRFEQDHLELATAIAAIAAIALETALRISWLEEETQRLQGAINLTGTMIGESPRMREVARFIGRVASTDATVLIHGETGTGKELVARAIHSGGPRAGRPFVAINCAAITESLLESELFGHEKGAFTGAISQKKGKLEVADGGTVFLDEVGELAAPLQAKLLRVLQEREFERVGGTRPIKIDVRLLAATNRDLEEAVRAGTFRQDLYYRLNVVRLTMPALRDRREDIPLLASYFAARYSERFNRRIQGLSPEARECLVAYQWPGNVRELENAIEHAIALGVGEVIRPEDLPETLLETETPGAAPATRYHEAVNEAKKQVVLKAIAAAGGSFTEGANLLGVHPNYLHRLVKNMGLRTALKK